MKQPSFLDRAYTAYSRGSDHMCKLRILGLLRKLKCLRYIFANNRSGLMFLDTWDYVQKRIFEDSAYEIATCNLLDKLLQDGDTMLDIGANVGQFSLLAAKHVGEKGCVIAVEPNAEIFSDLRFNIQLNKLTNIKPILCAVSDRSEILAFRDPPPENRGTSRIAESVVTGAFSVGAFSVPEILTFYKLGSPKLIKIDVEGAEKLVLNGLFLSPQYRPDHIVFEFLPNDFEYGSSPQLLLDLVKGNGYELRTVTGDLYDLGTTLPDDNVWAKKTSY